MTLSDWIGIIGVIVGLIGIVVGCIGAKGLYVNSKNKYNNKTGDIENSNVNQAQVQYIQNGMDYFAVIRLSQETTKKEMSDIMQKVMDRISHTENELENMSRIHVMRANEIDNANIREGDLIFMVDEE